MIRQDITEAFRRGAWGYVDDTLAFTRPWGFDVREIRIPTRIIYGLTDVLAPLQHGQWLARNVPNAVVVEEEALGHIGSLNLVTERFGWLVRPV